LESVIKRVNLSKLSRREKIIVAGGGGLLVLFMLVQLVIVPVYERNSRLKRGVQSKAQILEEMQRLKSEYDSLNSRAKQSEARFTSRDKSFTLFSFLDQLAGQARVKERVSYMRPTKTEQKNSPLKLSRVEMKLEAVTLEQLAAFLHGVETSKNMVSVSKLSVSRRDQKEGLLDAILQVDTLEP
jgi:general secretion pathway protein M